MRIISASFAVVDFHNPPHPRSPQHVDSAPAPNQGIFFRRMRITPTKSHPYKPQTLSPLYKLTWRHRRTRGIFPNMIPSFIPIEIYPPIANTCSLREVLEFQNTHLAQTLCIVHDFAPAEIYILFIAPTSARSCIIVHDVPKSCLIQFIGHYERQYGPHLAQKIIYPPNKT